MILEGWHCPTCHVFNGEEKSILSVCRSCATERPKRISTALAMALARSLESGKHDSEVPKNMVFSYVGFSILLARYVLEQTENRNYILMHSGITKEFSPTLVPGTVEPTGAEQVTESLGGTSDSVV
jgi:hypothetical protein